MPWRLLSVGEVPVPDRTWDSRRSRTPVISCSCRRGCSWPWSASTSFVAGMKDGIRLTEACFRANS